MEMKSGRADGNGRVVECWSGGAVQCWSAFSAIERCRALARFGVLSGGGTMMR